MLTVRNIILVMLRSAFIVAFLSIQKPVIAFTGLRNWSRKALYAKVDLCTQSCYSQIVPGLYLTNLVAATDRHLLRVLNTTHVLTVQRRRLPPSTFEGLNISYLFIAAHDTNDTNLLPFFPITNTFIEDGIKHGNVIVHCKLGVSRSSTLVIAYLMKKYKITAKEAFLYVRTKRPFINPNSGFVRQLKLYEYNDYHVGRIDRIKAYLRINSGENAYKMITVLVVTGVILPIAAIAVYNI